MSTEAQSSNLEQLPGSLTFAVTCMSWYIYNVKLREDDLVFIPFTLHIPCSSEK